MEEIIKWVLIGVFALFLLIGFLVGLIRGVKRAGVHIGFIVLSLILAFLLTKTITGLILGIKISFGGTPTTISDYIIKMIEENFDLSSYKAASDFVAGLPVAIASPFVFIALETVTYFFLDIIYLIVAKVSFGKKKEDFKNHKPNRLLGALVGTIEGFILMFMVFAPVTSLSKTFAEVTADEQTASSSAFIPSSSGKLETFGQMVSKTVPSNVLGYVDLFNDSVIGKVMSVGGLNNVMFDSMSKMKINGEKIYLRKDMVSIADTYNSFVVVYNAVKDKNYEVSVEKLTANIDKILDGGLFKAVVVPTIKEVVINYDAAKEDLHLNLPELLEKMTKNLKGIFEQEGFDAYKYIRSDLSVLMDIADESFKNKLVKNVVEFDFNNAGTEELLNFINNNSSSVKKEFVKLTKMNVVSDNFDIVVETAQQKLTENIENLQLNPNVENKEQLINDVVYIADEVKKVNDKTNIGDLVKGDMIEKLNELNENDINTVLNGVGNILDKARNMDILILPVEEGVRDEQVFVIDEILKGYNVELLGDTVYGLDGTEQTLDTYTKFLNYIKLPIIKAKNLGLLNVVVGDGSFTDVENNVLAEFKLNENLLNEMMLPLYQIRKTTDRPNKLDLKEKVFDVVVDMLADNVSILNFAGVKAENNLNTWKSELGYIGETINILNADSATLGKTYYEYVKTTGYDLNTLLDALIDEGALEDVLDKVFTAKVFANLKAEVFETIDTKIGDFTGETPTTDLTSLATTKTETIQTIISLLNETRGVTTISGKEGLVKVGKFLDILKTNANLADGNGVFKAVFENVIWYATNDARINTTIYSEKTSSNTSAADVKAYLNAADGAAYFTINYTAKMTELKEVVELADTLSTALEGKDLSTPANAQEFIETFVSTISDMSGSEEEIIETIEGLKTLIDGVAGRSDYLTEEQKTAYKDNILDEIEKSEYGLSADVQAAIRELIGIAD